VSNWAAADVGDLTGKTYLITGGNSGVGLGAAQVLAKHGARVVIGCRDPERAETARKQIADNASGVVQVAALDLADLDSVAACVKAAAGDFPVIDGLICNAGIMGGAFAESAQGYERQMATNHLGHFALVAGLWPAVSAAPAGRVVVVSSLASRGGKLDASMTRETLVAPTPYKQNVVYSNTKQANLLFAQELHRRAAKAGSTVRSIACHPGVSATRLFGRQLHDMGLGIFSGIADRVILPIMFQSNDAGALPTVRAATDPAVESGAFVGPTFLGGSRGKPHIIDVFSVGTDEATASRLWELTEEITGITFEP
jgi:NAD(P)-dependent dehydrogenase (short-subunit alcohol dehydrogenase family)